MDCQEVQKFIHAYVDGEFDEREWAALRAHLEVCSSCDRMARFEERFRAGLRQALRPAAAPDGLRARVAAALDQAELPASWQRRWALRLLPAAAAVALALGVGLSQRREEVSPIAEQSIELHRLQLPMDVSSPRPEQIQSFFSDKVPFAVRVPRMGRAKLVGARLASLRDHRAVYLNYRVGDRRISVFLVDPDALPSGGQVVRVGDRDLHLQGVRGYNVLTYTSGGMGYAVASDMDPRGMVQLIDHSE